MFFAYAWFTKWYSDKRKQIMKEKNKYEDRCGGLLIDSILNAESVRYFSSLDYENKRYDAALSEYE